MYSAVASHIMSFSLDDVWTDRFPPGKRPRIIPATFVVMNDLKQFISQKDNDIFFDIYTDPEVNFIKGKIEEWDFATASMKMKQDHYCFGGDFEIFLMSMI